MYNGNECFVTGSKPLDLSLSDFWERICFNMQRSELRSMLAEFLVISSLENMGVGTCVKRCDSPYCDVITNSGYVAIIKSAAYTDSEYGDRPDCISFQILPSENMKMGVYVFCLYKGMTENDTPLNLDLWEFYIVPSQVISQKISNRKSITLPALMDLDPILSDFYGIGEAINTSMELLNEIERI